MVDTQWVVLKKKSLFGQNLFKPSGMILYKHIDVLGLTRVHNLVVSPSTFVPVFVSRSPNWPDQMTNNNNDYSSAYKYLQSLFMHSHNFLCICATGVLKSSLRILAMLFTEVHQWPVSQQHNLASHAWLAALNQLMICKWVNKGVYNFQKSKSQVYNFAYKLHFTIIDHGQNIEGSFRWKRMAEITCWAW